MMLTQNSKDFAEGASRKIKAGLKAQAEAETPEEMYQAMLITAVTLPRAIVYMEGLIWGYENKAFDLSSPPNKKLFSKIDLYKEALKIAKGN